MITAYGPVISPETRLDPRTIDRESAIERPESAKPTAGAGKLFADMLREAISNDSAAQQAVDGYATGQSQNLHETMIAIEKADISLSLLVNVRNKLLDAYREVMRMS